MRVKITDLALRDAHQSLLATRMRTEDMLPIAPLMDEIGYWSVEMWGGATFDTCLRFLKEDPWERITLLKKEMPNTPFQMLLRGQNIVGYKHYSDDILEKFIEKAYERGIEVFRIFDALNDTRNMQTAMRTVKRCGGIVEASISYTISPVHNIPLFVKIARRLQEMGADTLCIKDMAGLISPMNAFELVKQLREETALAGALPLPRHLRHVAGLPFQGRRGRGGDTGHRHLVALHGNVASPHRDHGGHVEGDRMGHRPGPEEAGRDRGVLRQGAQEVCRLRERAHRHRYRRPAYTRSRGG